MSSPGGAQPAGLARRIGASVYEALLLTALLLATGFALLPLVTPGSDLHLGPGTVAGTAPTLYLMTPGAKAGSGAIVLALCASYCVGLWSGGRRTLPMKTWQLGLRTAAGLPVAPSAAAVRFVACWVGPLLAVAAYAALRPHGQRRWALAFLAFNYAWALIDRDRLLLQDRIAGTRLIFDPSPRH